MRSRIKPIVAIFITVFLDLLAFGLVIPDIQLRADKFTNSGLMIGLAISLYSIVQFLLNAPVGRASDILGRRPILLVTPLIGAVSALVYGHATTFALLCVARVVQGLAGANLGAAFAYISDSTTPEERGASMGLIGAAFGLGFVFGPPIGSWLITLGGGEPLVLGYVSAGLYVLNFLFVYFFLPESIKERASADEAKAKPIQQLRTAFSIPGLGGLLALFFVANLAMANLETTFFQVGKYVYGISQQQTTNVLVLVGIVAIITQGFLIKFLMARFGEVRLLRAGYLLAAPSIAAVPWAMPWAPLIIGCICLAFGTSITGPAISSLISKAAPPTMVGGVFGVTQSLGAIARIIGPIVANSLFAVRPWIPYALAGVLMLVPLGAAWRLRPQTTEPEPAPAT